jgi:hypothetical protein
VRNRRILGASQLALGALLLIVPRAVAGALAGEEKSPPVAAVRLLGGRLLVQGAVLASNPSDRVLKGAISIDVLHGASMILAAGAMPEYRRSLLSSAALAGGSVLVGLGVRG